MRDYCYSVINLNKKEDKEYLINLIKKDEINEIKLLLDNNSKKLKDEIFSLAAFFGSCSIVSFLLKDKDVNSIKDNNYALRFSVINSHIEVLKLLLKDKKIKKHINGEYILSIAIFNGNLEIIKTLLKCNKVNYLNKKNLPIAVESKDIEIVRFFLDYNPKKPLLSYLVKKRKEDEKEKEDNLKKAINKSLKIGDIEIMKLLLEQKKVNIDYNKLFEKSCMYGHIDLFNFFLKEKRIYDFRKPFENAFKYGQIEILKRLLNIVNEENFNGKFFHCFSDDFFIENVNYLLTFNNNKKTDELIKLLLTDKRSNNSYPLLFYKLGKFNRLNLIKIILEKPFDLSKCYLKTIIAAKGKKSEDVINYLWNNTNVKNELLNANKTIYNDIKKHQIKNKIFLF